MYTPTRSPERMILAAGAVAAAVLCLSAVTSGFLPADPRVEIARSQAILDRVDHVQDARAAQGVPTRIASVVTIVR